MTKQENYTKQRPQYLSTVPGKNPDPNHYSNQVLRKTDSVGKGFSVLGDVGGILGAAGSAAPFLGATGVAAAPILVGGAAAAGVGYGIYKLGHAANFW